MRHRSDLHEAIPEFLFLGKSPDLLFFPILPLCAGVKMDNNSQYFFYSPEYSQAISLKCKFYHDTGSKLLLMMREEECVYEHKHTVYEQLALPLKFKGFTRE